jgi:hypothetical protein
MLILFDTMQAQTVGESQLIYVCICFNTCPCSYTCVHQDMGSCDLCFFSQVDEVMQATTPRGKARICMLVLICVYRCKIFV